jgi:hypothetical protein
LNEVLADATTASASAVTYVTQAKTVKVVGNTTLDFVLMGTPGCAYTLAVTSQNAPAGDKSFSLTATSEEACAWAAATSTPRIRLGTASGTSPAIVMFTVAASRTLKNRS